MGWVSKLFDKKQTNAANDGGKDGSQQELQSRDNKKTLMDQLGPDGKPMITSKQMDMAMLRIRQRKDYQANDHSKANAKEEERNYVEFRKQQILRDVQPTVAALRLGDEYFPKKKNPGPMLFGLRKAYYLNLRPNPKYAVWAGRKTSVSMKPPPGVKKRDLATATTVMVTDHSLLPERDRKDDMCEFSPELDEKTAAEGENKSERSQRGEFGPGTPGTPRKTTKLITANKNANNLFHPGTRELFWTGPAAQEEVNDDDCPVDMDVLEKVCNGEVKLHQRPYTKTDFMPFAPIAYMKADDVFFVRDTILFANTVESVISLQPEDDKKKPGPEVERKIRYTKKISVIMYHPDTRTKGKPDKAFDEVLFEHVRDTESVAKAAKKKK